MIIRVTPTIQLSEVFSTDKSAYLDHLNHREIYENTLAIPFPYKESDAEAWFKILKEQKLKYGKPINFAIRNKDGFLIGGIGFNEINPLQPHRTEIGYWLAKAYWNQGIMSDVVNCFVKMGCVDWGFKRITAHVFHFNVASARVLEKAGFHYEGTLKNYYLKDGKIFDGKLYGYTI